MALPPWRTISHCVMTFFALILVSTSALATAQDPVATPISEGEETKGLQTAGLIQPMNETLTTIEVIVTMEDGREVPEDVEICIESITPPSDYETFCSEPG